ncbi:potassium channel subfamily K member 18 [Gastrophryne carolinensis]
MDTVEQWGEGWTWESSEECPCSDKWLSLNIAVDAVQQLEGQPRDNLTSETDILLDKLWKVSQDVATPVCWNESSHSFSNVSRNVSENICGNVSWVTEDEESFKTQSRDLIAPYVKSNPWTFHRSLFFCCAVVTTVGYGDLTPITMPGRIVFMVYAAIGIPLMLLVLADLGDILARILSKSYKYLLDAWAKRARPFSKLVRRSSSLRGLSGVSSKDSTLASQVTIKEPLNLTDVLKTQESVKRKYMQLRNIEIFELIIIKQVLPVKYPFRKSHSCPELDFEPPSESALSNFDKLGEELDKLNVPCPLILLIVVAYLTFGSFILRRWEEWDMLEAFYFCFVTLTTIGFGDIIPDHPNYFLLISAYTIIGMAIMVMAFKLMQNRMVCLYKQCILCISGGHV